jgi:predicted dehydrogenase
VRAGDRLRWGILGTGNIARDFARGAAASQTGHAYAVGSRHRETADDFAGQFGIERTYGSYEAVLADSGVDAVYVALPNSMHATWAVKAAEAGKHILCEKPFTANVAEAEMVVAAARRHDVFLMEAMLYRCHPQVARVAQLLADGVIGDVRLVECRFGTDIGRKLENIRFSKQLAGGSIMDVGCYVASYAALVAGAAPDSVTGTAHIGAESGVDEWATASMRFPNGPVASLVCGTRVLTERDVWVWGEGGSIRVLDPWKPWVQTSRIVVIRKGAEPEEIVLARGGDPWVHAIDLVGRHIDDRQVPRPGMTWEDSICTMRVLDAWRAAAGVSFDTA